MAASRFLPRRRVTVTTAMRPRHDKPRDGPRDCFFTAQLEAEEMIFIADLKDDQEIDFTEFKQVVVNWSG